jgi:PhnB protein
MPTVLSHIRHGRGSARPYLCGPVDLPKFVSAVFQAVELERHEFGPQSFHVEMQVGDSVVVIEAGALPAEVKPWQASVYVYVEEVDAVFARAIELGGQVLAPVEDKPYRERQGGFLDAAGNTWWVATYQGK